jgi:aldehyde dehydrogenase (NAD+)
VTVRHDSFYIGGQMVPASTSATITVRDASTEDVIGVVPDGAESDVDAAVNAARAAFDEIGGWSHWEPARRQEALERFAAALESRASATAEIVSRQNGMPIAISSAFEAGFPALTLRYYGAMVAEQGVEELRPGMMGGTTVVRREPVGVVAAIIPWNYPQSLGFLKIAPALAAGCTVVLKPPPETVLDAYLMVEAAIEAVLPPGVLNVVPAGREVGAHLVRHPGVDKVSFTGSTAAGRSIAEECGRLIRPVTLELGGKSAAVVLDDADLAGNAAAFVDAAMQNNGQACYLSTRILAPRSRYSELVDTISDMVGTLKVGSPLDPAVDVGPVVSARQRDRIEGYIAKGRAEGARVTVGGDRPASQPAGWFVSPTVFVDVDNNHTIAQEEIFGPVLAVIPYSDQEDAIRLANDTDYGLGGTVWSADPERAVAVARRLRTGTVGLNAYAVDPSAPFGGIKCSGYGRQMGPEGLAPYQVYKSIYGAPGGA